MILVSAVMPLVTTTFVILSETKDPYPPYQGAY